MIGKIRQNIRELGIIETGFYGLQRLLAKGGVRLLRYALVAQPVWPDPRLKGRRGASMTTREVCPGDPALKAMPLNPDVIAYRQSQGAHCLGLFLDDEMIGCLWLCLESYDEDEVFCRFIPHPADKAGWDFDVFLLPEYRGGVGFLRLWDAGNAFLRERGREWSCSRISVFNQPSVLAHKSMGAQVLGTATFLVLGRYQIMLTTVPPFCDISRNLGRGPRLVLRAPVKGA